MKIRRIPIHPDTMRNPLHQQVLNDLVASLEYILPVFNESIGQVVPKAEFLRDGMLAYADGSNWDPGAGEGYYRYNTATSTWEPCGPSLSYSVVTKTDTYLATSADDLIVCNKSSAMTINLPAASGGGKVFSIKNINTGTVTVDGNNSDTIDGAATRDLSQWDVIQIVDYAANSWVII